MSTVCALCMAIGRPLPGPLLPMVVTYRGYSVCVEHLNFWEGCRSEDGEIASWRDVVNLARASEFKVVKVDMTELKTDEEKIEAIEEAAEQFDEFKAGGFKDPEDMMLGRAMDANDPPSLPQVTMSEKKLAEAKNKRRRRKKTYYCTKCDKKHSRKSNIGKKHKEFAQ